MQTLCPSSHASAFACIHVCPALRVPRKGNGSSATFYQIVGYMCICTDNVGWVLYLICTANNSCNSVAVAHRTMGLILNWHAQTLKKISSMPHSLYQCHRKISLRTQATILSLPQSDTTRPSPRLPCIPVTFRWCLLSELFCSPEQSL